MKILILLTIMLSSIFGEDFISINSDNYFVNNRITLVNTFVNEMKEETNSSVLISKVNYFCNEFTYTSDIKLYNKSDYWASPVEFVINGGGDCEDFVVIKYEILKSLGFKDMFYATKKVNGILHAILLVKDGEKIVILDNMRNTLYIENLVDLKIYSTKTIERKLS